MKRRDALELIRKLPAATSTLMALADQSELLYRNSEDISHHLVILLIPIASVDMYLVMSALYNKEDEWVEDTHSEICATYYEALEVFNSIEI